MKDATRAVRSGLTPAVAGTALQQGPVFASTFHTPGSGANAPYSYGCAGQPTWTALETAIAQLEVHFGSPAAQVRVYASGSAAMSAVMGSLLKAGDTIVLQDGAYFGTRHLLQEFFVPMGVSVRLLSWKQLTDPHALAGARLVWAETPGNPGHEIVDIAAVAAVAHSVGALLAVDNTTACPLSQKPLELGADVSVCSNSKAMCGHNDLLLGHVAVRDEELAQKLGRYRGSMGAIAGPMEAWLALRSLATLPLRLDRMSTNALALAKFLQTRQEVTAVLYPGLESHPDHALAVQQMTYFGPVLGFTLRNQQAAGNFLTRCTLVTEATSFGGMTTTAERRGRWGHDPVAPGFIRLSAGCEDIEDLLNDLGQALDSLA